LIYLAADHSVALFEVAALLGSPLPGHAFVPNPAGAWTVINVTVRLSRVVDLCRASQRRLVGTTVQELTGDWRGYSLRGGGSGVAVRYPSIVPTQRLGAALHARRGVEGFLTYSAKVPTKRNLVIFPGKLLAGSSVEFTDAHGVTHSVP
jgi:hypothetical protein